MLQLDSTKHKEGELPQISKLTLHTDGLQLIMIDKQHIINIELIKECIGELNISAEKDFRSDPLT